jgi:hypothetical protein
MAPASAALLATALALSACKSAAPGNALAAIEIHGNTPGQISAVATEVFREAGYAVRRSGPNSLVGEKKAGAWSDLSYGNWTGNPVWVRLRTSISPVSERVFRLECKAWLVRDRGDTTEEEIELSKFRSGPYQKLLEDVAKRLGDTGDTGR